MWESFSWIFLGVVGVVMKERKKFVKKNFIYCLFIFDLII